MIPDWWCNPSPLCSDILSPELIRAESILSGCILTKLFGFKRFSRPFRVSFHLLLTLLFHYQSWDIFRFASVYLAHSYEKTIPHYSGYLAAAFQITVTRLSRSMARHFRGIHFFWLGRTGSTLHISLGLSPRDSVWSVPLSLAVTNGITIVFFSSWY